jgi:hypothetical protein
VRHMTNGSRPRTTKTRHDKTDRKTREHHTTYIRHNNTRQYNETKNKKSARQERHKTRQQKTTKDEGKEDRRQDQTTEDNARWDNTSATQSRPREGLLVRSEVWLKECLSPELMTIIHS